MPAPLQRDNLSSGHWEVIELAEEPVADHQAGARAQGPVEGRRQNDAQCRSEVHVDGAPGSWTLVGLLLVAALGTWLGRSLIVYAPDAARFTQGNNKVALGTWAALIGAFFGYGLAAAVVMSRWVWQVLKIFKPAAPRRSVAGWALVTGLILVTVLAAGTLIPAATVRFRPVFSGQIVIIAVAGAVIALPGLVGFLALRSLARNDDQWHEEPRCQVLMVIRLRQRLRRLLGTFGLLLTLLVVETAARRHLVLTFYKKNAAFSPEFVLLYGLLFAAMLALFHITATMAIDGRCQRLLTRYAPIPNPDEKDISTPLSRRQDLAALLEVGGSWQQSFQNGIVVLAPLLTALIGTALQK